jgi:glycosyltransferase involved in cell wall biosynthesis
MKIALVHDYIKEYGGAEKVLETLHEIYPKAPIYTSVYLPKYLGPHKERFAKMDIRPSWLQMLPLKAKLISMFRFIAAWVFESFDLTKYDVVITSAAGTYSSPNLVSVGKKTKLFCYCHTPPRYLYGYATANDWQSNLFRKVLFVLGKIPMHFLRMTDYEAAQKPDYFITNSNETKSRIYKFYRREATVIYPPVDIPTISHHPLAIKHRGYYLAGGRLARAKRPDLAIAACTKLGLPLKVFGREFAGYGAELKEIAGPTVEFLGEVTDEEKYKLMAGARAFIFPADNEDFGITPVEAMASGTPVIAHRSGGVVETVIEGKTGLFFDEFSVKSLSAAIKKFEKMTFNPEECISQAKKFSKERFVKEITKFIETKSQKT